MKIEKELHKDLYYKKEIVVKKKGIANGNPLELSIELRDFDGTPDCRFGNFGYNFWMRTPLAIKNKAYSSAKKLEKAIEIVLKNKGFTVIGWTPRNY